jgi:hypothetical protein
MKKVKDFIKKNPEPAKGTNYVNPSQLGQYSAKHQVSEGALEQYLSSKGINADHLPLATKIAHSKSNEFIKWKRDHIREDKTVSDSPTRKKLGDLNRSQSSHSEIKTARGPGSHNQSKGNQMTQLTPEEVKKTDPAVKAWDNRYLVKNLLKYLGLVEAKKPKMTALDKFRAASYEREKKRNEFMKSIENKPHAEKMKAMMDKIKSNLGEESEHKVGDMVTVDSKFFGKQKGKVTKVDNQSVHVQRDGKKYSEKYPHNAVMKEEVLDESKRMSAQLKLARAFDREQQKSAASRERAKQLLNPTKPPEQKVKEDVGDPQAATQSPADGANGGQELAEKKRQMSKSARMIKALYKKKGVVKEDLFDGEKEDKSVATYGKKPKFDKAEKDEGGEKKPEAAAVLSGGTTLTGNKRDTVEIDPSMRNRPGQPDVTKKDDKKKDGKEEDKKKDK